MILKIKTDKITTGAATLTLLRNYYKECKTKEHQFGGKYSATSTGKALARTIERSGVPKRRGLHSFRHNFATHLLESDTGLCYIQELFGYNSSKTT